MTNANLQSASFSPTVTMNLSGPHDKHQSTTSLYVPASNLVTPESEGSISASSQEDNSSAEFLSPIPSMKNLSLYWSSSGVTPSTVLAHSEEEGTNSNSNCIKSSVAEPCSREPSPQQERRTLFHDHSRDDYPPAEVQNSAIPNQGKVISPNMISQEYISRATRSGGPGLPLAKKDFERFCSSGSEMQSNSTSSHRLRSRRYQQNQLSDIGNESTSTLRGSDRRKQSRRRPSSTTKSYNSSMNGSSHGNLSFSLPVVQISDDVSVSSDVESEELNVESPRKIDRKYRYRPRRKHVSSSSSTDLSNGGSNSDNNGVCHTLIGKYLSNQRVTTKALVWSLCVVGIISISMVVTTSRKITSSFVENPHERVTILFQPAKNQPRINHRARMLPSLGDTIPDYVATVEQTRQRGSVNLHSLSRFQGGGEVISSSTSDDTRTPVIKHVKTAAKHHRHSNHHKDSSHANVKKQTEGITSVYINEPMELHLVHPATSIVESNSDSFLANDLSYMSSNSINKRIISIGGSDLDSLPNHRDLELFPSPFTDNTQVYPLLDSSDEDEERMRTMERRPPYEDGECVPMAEWQTTFHPSCNGMHELNIADSDESDQKLTLFGKNGFWRNAWRFDSTVNGPSLETVVLKTLRINHRFEEKYYEHNRIDAVVLERLTGSRHVIDIFGFCGHSVLTEFADGKRLGDLADKKRKIPLARLKIAIDIASGLADVHNIDGENNASFVHLDINPANVVSINGTLKLNDFNIGVPRKWNTTSNEACGIPSQYPNPQWRSPEEARGEHTLTEKVDVFSLGHIFFRLICGHEPWHKLEPNGMPSKAELNEKVKNGVLPTIPSDVLKSRDPEVIAIRDAMLQCYQYNPMDRPSARNIVKALQSTLLRLERKKM